MKKQNLILIFFIFCFVLSASQAFAIEKTIQQSVKEVFWWAISISALLAVLSFAWGAIEYMATDHASGKDRMTGSILGLILVFSSWIILQTINPKITTLELGNLQPVGVGVFYAGPGISSTNPLPPVPTQVSNASEPKEKQYDSIRYDCFLKDKNGRLVEQPNLLVWKYNKPNFVSSKPNGEADGFERINCGGGVPIPAGSFRYAFEVPGVYFYTGNNCENGGVSSEAFTSDLSPIPDPFYGNIGSLRIINAKGDQKIGSGMGVILHENPKLEEGGLCEPQIYYHQNDGESACKKVTSNISVHAADIFYLAKDPKASGTGINFYSNILGWQSDKDSGYYEIPAGAMRLPYYDLYSDQMLFKWEKAQGAIADRCRLCTSRENSCQECAEDSAPNSGCCPCKTFDSCYGSIQMNGDYVISIDQVIEENDTDWCQTFKTNVDNLKTKSFFTGTDQEGHGFDGDLFTFSVYIIPITH